MMLASKSPRYLLLSALTAVSMTATALVSSREASALTSEFLNTLPRIHSLYETLGAINDGIDVLSFQTFCDGPGAEGRLQELRDLTKIIEGNNALGSPVLNFHEDQLAVRADALPVLARVIAGEPDADFPGIAAELDRAIDSFEGLKYERQLLVRTRKELRLKANRFKDWNRKVDQAADVWQEASENIGGGIMNGLSGSQLQLAALCLGHDLSTALAGVAPALEKAASLLDEPIEEADRLIKDYGIVIDGYKITRDGLDLTAAASDARRLHDENAASIPDPNVEKAEQIAGLVRGAAKDIVERNRAAKAAAEEARKRRIAANDRAGQIASFFDLIAAGAEVGAMISGSGGSNTTGAAQGHWFRYTRGIKTMPDGTTFDIREGEGFVPDLPVKINGPN